MPNYLCDRPKYSAQNPNNTCSHVTVLNYQLGPTETVACQGNNCTGTVSRLGKHARNVGTRSGINPNGPVPNGPHFAGNFQTHMMHGENVAGGTAHSGLHSLNAMNQGRINGAAVNIVQGQNSQNTPFLATVRLGAGAPKQSSFFPSSMNYQAIRAAVIEAWTDYQRYQTVDIYQRMVAKSRLQWVGYARLAGRKTWVGSDRNGTNANIYTAFPAINGRFF